MYVHSSWCVVSWNTNNDRDMFETRGENSYSREQKRRGVKDRREEKTILLNEMQQIHQILTRKAVVNCASALSIQLTEIQYRPWDMKRAGGKAPFRSTIRDVNNGVCVFLTSLLKFHDFTIV